jgi:pimeloyl-ACP methyl ester carboxylesterase
LIYDYVDATSDKPIIHFAHANSFPAASYKQFFEALSDDFQILAIAQFGHNEQYPVNDNWDNQVDELINFISANAPKPVISIGHSLGGVIAYKAACKRPDLFSNLILLDPPIITGLAARVFRFAKLTPLIDKLTPSGKSKLRTTEWEVSEDLIQYFASRALFYEMPESVIQDYINAAIVKEEERFTLSFKAEVETALFRNIPHDLSKYAGKLLVPSTLISAEYSNVYRPSLVSTFLRQNSVTHEVFRGVGHLFPLEQPTKTADYVKQSMLKNNPNRP